MKNKINYSTQHTINNRQHPISQKISNLITKSPAIRVYDLQLLCKNQKLVNNSQYKKLYSKMEIINNKIKNKQIFTQTEASFAQFLYRVLMMCLSMPQKQVQIHLSKIDEWYQNRFNIKRKSVKIQRNKTQIKDYERVRQTYKSLLPIKYLEEIDGKILFPSKKQRYALFKPKIKQKVHRNQYTEILPSIDRSIRSVRNIDKTLKKSMHDISVDNTAQMIYRNEIKRLCFQRQKQEMQQQITDMKKNKAIRNQQLVKSMNTSIYNDHSNISQNHQSRVLTNTTIKQKQILRKNINKKQFIRNQSIQKENLPLEDIDGLKLLKLTKKQKKLHII